MIIDVVTQQDFEARTKTGKYLVKFWAPWCGPCRMLTPVLEQIADKIDIINVNIDEAKEIAATFDLPSIPTMVLIKDSVVLDKKNGFMTKSAIEKWLGVFES